MFWEHKHLRQSNLHLALRTNGGAEHLWERRKSFGIGMHPVNAELRAGNYRDTHTTRCGGNLEKRERWLSGALEIERRAEENKTIYLQLPFIDSSTSTLWAHHCPIDSIAIVIMSSSGIEHAIGLLREQTHHWPRP